MGHTNTKRMVQGAMIAALFGALSLINTYTGSLFDIFICYGMVIPIVWYGYTYDIKSNIIVCIVSMFVIMMMGLPFFIISSFSSCLAGLFIGEALRRKAKKETILLGTFGVSLLNNVLIYEVFSGLLDVDLVSEMTSMYQGMVEVVPDFAQVISLDMTLSLIPIVLILTSAMEMYLILLLCQLILTRLKVEFPGSFHLSTFHMSKKTGMLLVILTIGAFILQKLLSFHIYLEYIYILGVLAFGLQGCSFISFYCIVNHHSGLMFLAFFGIFIPYVHTLYPIVGILDIFSDLRKNILYNKNNND